MKLQTGIHYGYGVSNLIQFLEAAVVEMPGVISETPWCSQHITLYDHLYAGMSWMFNHSADLSIDHQICLSNYQLEISPYMSHRFLKLNMAVPLKVLIKSKILS